jgi:hypothetical protein
MIIVEILIKAVDYEVIYESTLILYGQIGNLYWKKLATFSIRKPPSYHFSNMYVFLNCN